MPCALCRRLRDLFWGRQPCEACENAMQAVAKHERSTQNLTRAALDQIDQSAVLSGDTNALFDEMLSHYEPKQ